MPDEVYTFALNNALGEIKNVCPDVSHILIFKENNEILAKDTSTDEETAVSAVDAFRALTKRAEVTGGIESLTLNGADGQMNITRMGDYYLANITSNEADEKYVKALTRVLVPTIFKLIDMIHPASADGEQTSAEQSPAEESAAPERTPKEENPGPNTDAEPLLAEPPVNQFIVENLRGLGDFLGSGDTVRVDSTTLMQWKELCGDKEIEEVIVKTLDGKTARCKLKPTKGSEYDGKGVVQIPEKIQQDLHTKKGELVTVQPVIDSGDNSGSADSRIEGSRQWLRKREIFRKPQQP
jgi:hypothetical protein